MDETQNFLRGSNQKQKIALYINNIYLDSTTSLTNTVMVEVR